MRLWDESVVRADEIDTLGHMNIHHYMQRVQRASDVLMDCAGVAADYRRGTNVTLSRTDTYCRYYREQFAGAPIEVFGGVLGATPVSARLFFEVRNPAKSELAATFVIELRHEDLASRAHRPLPPEAVRLLQSAKVALPEYGAPRSIRLELPRLDLAFEHIEARAGEVFAGAPMGGRLERTIDPEDCDAYGFLRAGDDLMFGARRRAQIKQGRPFGPPTFVSDEGRSFAWALMETRVVKVATPRDGDVLRSVAVDIGLHRKTRHSRRWIYNATTKGFAGIDDSVSVALDLDARRSIEIPLKVRKELEGRYVPELA
jgi:acyl-CoA thioester hydrolase